MSGPSKPSRARQQAGCVASRALDDHAGAECDGVDVVNFNWQAR
jgi:hypothetical protein